MNVRIILPKAEPNDAFREYVQQRVHYGLLPFEHRISKATLVFSDTNGPRGGPDQQCCITVYLLHGGEVRAEGRAVSARLALGRAAERVARQLRQLTQAARDTGRREARESKYRPAA